MPHRAKHWFNYYVATPYANGHTACAPFEYHGTIQSDQAIRVSR